MNWKRLAIVRATVILALLSTAVATSLLLRAGMSPSAVAPPRVAAPDAATTPALAPAVEAHPPAPVFRDWIAFGSGCRARSDERGDVTMERITVDSGSRVIHRARFHLEQYRLTSADRTAPPLDFASECAVRVQVGPPAGKRIARVTAKTGVASSKSEGVKLTILAELRIGVVTLGRTVLVHDAGTAHQGMEETFRFAPDARSAVFPDLDCAEGKLAGFDYTWIAERKGASDDVCVELSGERVLDIDVELEDCRGDDR